MTDTLLHSVGNRSGIEAMVEAMRRDICLGDPTSAMVLHETRLAERFGVSRTPVRQALQRLAYERLVETHSGIGTTVVPLEPDRIGAHSAMLVGLLHLAAELGVREIFDGGMALPEPQATPASPEDMLAAVFNHRAAILRTAGALIADPILQESHAAAHWRVLRWRMAAARAEPAAAFDAALTLRRAIGAERDPASVLGLIAAETAPAVHLPHCP